MPCCQLAAGRGCSIAIEKRANIIVPGVRRIVETTPGRAINFRPSFIVRRDPAQFDLQLVGYDRAFIKI
jgi:hypothetical protein